MWPGKLGIGTQDLTDPVIMTEVRQDLQIGVMNPVADCAKGNGSQIQNRRGSGNRNQLREPVPEARRTLGPNPHIALPVAWEQ